MPSIRKSTNYAVVIAIASLIMATAGNVGTYFLAQGETAGARLHHDEVCESFRVIRGNILAGIDRAIKQTPTIAYYKDHPDELKRAMDDLRESRKTYSTIGCKEDA